MKKLLLILVCITPFVLKAQIEQGKWLAGGSFLGNYEQNNQNTDQKKIDINTQLNAGSFVLNKLALGIRGQFGYSKTTNILWYDVYYNKMMIDIQESSFAVGPFARYYILPQTGRFNVYSEFCYAYGKRKLETSVSLGPGPAVINSHNYNFNIAPVYFINEHSSLELILGYYLQTLEKTKYTNVFVGVGFQLHLGGGKKAGK